MIQHLINPTKSRYFALKRAVLQLKCHHGHVIIFLLRLKFENQHCKYDDAVAVTDFPLIKCAIRALSGLLNRTKCSILTSISGFSSQKDAFQRFRVMFKRHPDRASAHRVLIWSAPLSAACFWYAQKGPILYPPRARRQSAKSHFVQLINPNCAFWTLIV